MGILTKIRQRPDNQKKIFAFVGAGVLTLVIIIAWLGFTTSAANTKVENPDKLSSLSPWQIIKDEFSKALTNFKQTTTDISSTSESLSSSTIPIQVIEATSTATSTASTTNQ